jgi:hypothetical protein
MDPAHPRLHQIFGVCKAVKGWLQLSDRNVAVIHCSNGRSRYGNMGWRDCLLGEGGCWGRA